MDLINENIAYYRRKKGMTQKELADIIGVTPAFISHLENGVSSASDDTIDKINNALELNRYDLFIPKDSLVLSDKIEIIKLVELIKELTVSKIIEWRISDNSFSNLYLEYFTTANGINYYFHFTNDKDLSDDEELFQLDISMNEKSICSITVANPNSKMYSLFIDLKNTILELEKTKNPLINIINDLEKLKNDSSKE